VATFAGLNTYTPAPDGSRFLTFRTMESGDALRTLYIDLGFAARLADLVARSR
jgi:hypothetical protein